MTATLRQALRDIAAAQMARDGAHDLAHLDRIWRVAMARAGTMRRFLTEVAGVDVPPQRRAA